VSPDPGNAGADPSSPQTWNGYSYVSNNPLNATDPTGMFVEAAGPGSTLGPVGTIIGGLIDLGELFGALFGLFGDGGGPVHTPLPPPTGTRTRWCCNRRLQPTGTQRA
jgi:hypothetical protein